MSTQTLPCVELEPRGPATAAVIWLHGLGANGHDFEPIVPALRLPATLQVRFVFPHAPAIPITINAGMVMPAWYDILEMNLGRRVDEAQLLRSALAVGELIDRERARGVPSDKIVVAGFSQGGAVGFQLALTYPHPLAGLLALSTYFATRKSIVPHPINAKLPVAIHHGLQDPLVPEAMGRMSADVLTEWGHPVEYKTYAMEHAVCPSQIADIGKWLSARLA
ncbi:MAG: dienelactone hydrolase family protein [Gammaproteobacteria bacterium]|nr:dienelactone hydrolase family protein [Gammaproteobacteria bacterium]